MSEAPKDPSILLAQAKEKAELLLQRVVALQADAEANSANVPAEAREAGRAMLEQAMQSARRTLDAIAAAQRVSDVEEDPGDRPNAPNLN